MHLVHIPRREISYDLGRARHQDHRGCANCWETTCLWRVNRVDFIYIPESIAAPEGSDAGLECLKGLPQLQLYLDGTNVSDAGLEHLKLLTQLRGLGIGGTKVGDAGLEQLKGLSKLELINLDNTKISDAGLKTSRYLPNSNDWTLGLASK